MERPMTKRGIAALCAYLAAALPAAKAGGPIGVTNYREGETIRFPVPLIRGSVADAKITSVTVINTSSRRGTRELTGLAHKGRFKALTELLPGTNRLVIRAGKDELPLTLTYKPQTNPYVVRVIYFTGRAGKTDFQTPIPNDPRNWRGKLDTAMKLMQTFTAERLGDLGLGRATFNLELDHDGHVKVHLLKGRLAAAAYQKLTGHQLYGAIGREIARRLPHKRARNLVIPAFTRFDPKTRKVCAHTALGGGSLALFGGGDLFAWPDGLADAQKAFMNPAPVDPKKWFSDSVGRHTFWAIASTTMGAALHELGHTFGLPHSRDAHDIMTRGHDRFNRFFTLVEPPHARRKRPYEFTDSEVACWSAVSGGALAPNRFFAMDARAWRDERRTVARFDRASGRIVIESAYGIRYVGVLCREPSGVTESVFCVPLSGSKAVKEVKLKPADLRKRVRKGEVLLRVLDGEGLGSTVSLKELLAGPFVRAWRFASTFPPWPDAGSFPEMDAGRLRAIEASAAKAKLRRSRSPYVDFLALSGSGRQGRVAAYAVRTIRSDRARKVGIHTGSDDALRMWLNGKLIASVLALRGAQADSETTEVELKKGDNRLVVEVSQGIGGWGLILRITDADGAKLELKDSGELVPVEGVGPKTK